MKARTNQNGVVAGSGLHFLVDYNLKHGMAAAARFVALCWFHCPVLVAAMEELHGFFNTARRVPTHSNERRATQSARSSRTKCAPKR